LTRNNGGSLTLYDSLHEVHEVLTPEIGHGIIFRSDKVLYETNLLLQTS
jgi:hypothetical protein